LSPPVRFSDRASEFFGAEFFVKTSHAETRDNFIEFGRAIEELGRIQEAERPKPKGLYQPNMTGTILDRFRAGLNAKDRKIPVAANDYAPPSLQDRFKAAIPSFLSRVANVK
jgi:hypothetical protein